MERRERGNVGRNRRNNMVMDPMAVIFSRFLAPRKTTWTKASEEKRKEPIRMHMLISCFSTRLNLRVRGEQSQANMNPSRGKHVPLRRGEDFLDDVREGVSILCREVCRNRFAKLTDSASLDVCVLKPLADNEGDSVAEAELVQLVTPDKFVSDDLALERA